MRWATYERKIAKAREASDAWDAAILARFGRYLNGF